MKSNCNICTHYKVCRLKNVCEKICKKIDDCLDITTDEKESFEVGQFEVEIKCKDFELEVPRTRGIENPNKNLEEVEQSKYLDLVNRGYHHKCEGCPTYEMLQKGGTYVGDLPCQWCDKNPNRVTFSDTVTFSSHCGTCSSKMSDGTCSSKMSDGCHYKKRDK